MGKENHGEGMKEKLERCIREEQQLRFKKFDLHDAAELGRIMYHNAAGNALPVALDIEVNDFQVFHICLEGSAPYNNGWIRKKQKMVHLRQMSSLHAGYILEDEEQDLETDWLLDPKEYAVKGGGFPILLENGTCIGCAACSGLPHEEDHRLVVESIREFLQKQQ